MHPEILTHGDDLGLAYRLAPFVELVLLTGRHQDELRAHWRLGGRWLWDVEVGVA